MTRVDQQKRFSTSHNNWHPDARFGRDERLGKPQCKATLTIDSTKKGVPSVSKEFVKGTFLWEGFVIRDDDASSSASATGNGVALLVDKIVRRSKKPDGHMRVITLEWEPNK